MVPETILGRVHPVAIQAVPDVVIGVAVIPLPQPVRTDLRPNGGIRVDGENAAVRSFVEVVGPGVIQVESQPARKTFPEGNGCPVVIRHSPALDLTHRAVTRIRRGTLRDRADGREKRARKPVGFGVICVAPGI